MAYLDELINSRLAAQIYSMRASRKITQAELSVKSGIAQPSLSKYEADCGGISTTTLKRIAAAFDVALVIKFVPFSEFAREIAEGKVDREVRQFSKDRLDPEIMNLPASGARSHILKTITAATPDRYVTIPSSPIGRGAINVQ